jgi:hypothetical protein
MNAVQDAASEITDLPVQPPSIIVYLNSGDVVPVTPATGLRVEASDVVVFMDEAEVARFPRRSVYFCSDVPMSPPALN